MEIRPAGAGLHAKAQRNRDAAQDFESRIGKMGLAAHAEQMVPSY